MPNNEKRIINIVDLEAVSGGGIPLPGVTIPTCPNCGSNESNTEFYNNNGKYYCDPAAYLRKNSANFITPMKVLITKRCQDHYKGSGIYFFI